MNDRDENSKLDHSRQGASTADPRLADVVEGLSRVQKELSPIYFYNDRGSILFEEITRLPEYYPTRTEAVILRSSLPAWIRENSPAALVELGAGSARKSRILLDAMVEEGSGRLFVPLDVSEEFLQRTARALRSDYPELVIAPEVADMTQPLDLPDDLPEPALFALLGGTIGNFAPDEAVGLLRRVRKAMRPGDSFLLGVDLRPSARKPVSRIELAYDDPAGITAAFNLNVLEVLNREMGADFDARYFEHRAFYCTENDWIEMHLVSLRPQEVHIPEGGTISFTEGETIRTEISCKYDRPMIDERFRKAGLRVEDWWEDESGLFALVLGTPCR